MTSTNQAHAKFTTKQLFIVLLLAATQFTVILDFLVMSPLGDLVMKSMDLRTRQFGFAVSVYSFSAAVSGLLTAGFADRFDRKKLLLFFYSGFILGTILCGLVHSYPMLLAARMVTGLFGGVIGAISLTIVSDIFPMNKRGRVMSYIQLGFSVSQILGIPTGLFLATHFGWQTPFLMIAGLAALIATLVMIYLAPVREHLNNPPEKSVLLHLFHTLIKKEHLIGFLTTGTTAIGGFMMMPWLSQFIINNLGLPMQQLPIVFLCAGLASFAVVPFIGKLSDKKDKYIIFTFASIWMVLVVLIYSNLTPVPIGIILLLHISLSIGIASRMSPGMALISGIPEARDRGAFMSVNASLQQLSGGVAGVVGGLIVAQRTKAGPILHFNIVGYVTAALALLSVILMRLVSRQLKRRTEKLASEPI